MLNPHHLPKLFLALPLLLLAALLGACAPAAPGAAVSPLTSCDTPPISAYIAYARDLSSTHFDTVASDFWMNAAAQNSGIASPVNAPVSIPSTVTTPELNKAIDEATVAFITAHGTPTGIEVADGNNTISLQFGPSLLGQCASGQAGRLRYLFLASCNVMEHGPQTCREFPTALPYGCPGEWSSTSQDNTMQNIYERWGPKLGDGLRMVCGSSTTMTPDSINKMWTYTSSVPVADKVLYGLSQDAHSTTPGVSVGVCLARGGKDFSKSPLMQDIAFQTNSNPFDDVQSPLYHMQYSRPLSSPHATGVAISNGVWQKKMILEQLINVNAAAPRCLPVDESNVQNSHELKVIPLGEQRQDLQGFESEAKAIASATGEQSFFDAAAAAVQKYTGEDIRLELATGLFDLLSTFPVDENQWKDAVPTVAVKNVFVNIPQVVQFDKLDLPQVLESEGDWRNLPKFFDQLSSTYERAAYNLGGGIEPLMPMLNATRIVQLNADGTPILIWDNTAPFVPDGYEAVRPVDEAFLRSLWQLYYSQLDIGLEGDGQGDDALVTGYLDAGKAKPEDIINMLNDRFGQDREPYVLDSWTLGYAPVDWSKEVAPKLRLVYRFRFVANDHDDAGYTAADYPPINVDVAAQTGQPCK